MSTLVRKTLIGAKVMLRSNEDEPILIGHIVRFENFGKANTFIPVVKLENGEEVFASSLVLKYEQKLFDFLNTLNNKEQYEIIANLYVFHSNLLASRKDE